MCVLHIGLFAEAGQPVVSNLQNKATVHHTVGGLQVTMGDDDAVVKEGHPLESKTV